MAATAKPQTPALLGVTASTYYTATPGTVGNIKELLVNNTTGTAAWFSVWFCPASVSPASSNMVINALAIASGTMIRIPYNTFIEASGTVQALANVANVVSIRVSAVEYT